MKSWVKISLLSNQSLNHLKVFLIIQDLVSEYFFILFGLARVSRLLIYLLEPEVESEPVRLLQYVCSEIKRPGMSVTLSLLFDNELLYYDLEGTQTDLLEVLQYSKELSKDCRNWLLQELISIVELY